MGFNSGFKGLKKIEMKIGELRVTF
jgi:hypothetical protein